MAKIEQIKIPVSIEDYKWKLIRENDNLEWLANDIKWIEWNNTTNKAKELHNSIDIGRSLILSPFSMYYTWMTTEVLEIMENTSDYIRFKTKNSVYKLIKL